MANSIIKYDKEGEIKSVGDLVFCDGILGEGSSAKVRLARYEGIKQNGTEKGKGKKSLRKQISFFKKKKKEIVRRSPQSNHLITKCMQSKFLTRPR